MDYVPLKYQPVFRKIESRDPRLLLGQIGAVRMQYGWLCNFSTQMFAVRLVPGNSWVQKLFDLNFIYGSPYVATHMFHLCILL